jgi:uncharacterized protein
MTFALVPAVLLASFLGSPHCAGMCGCFVAFYASGDSTSGRARFLSHIAYNGGRLFTYTLLGVMSGLLGRGLTLAGEHAHFVNAAALVMGLIMVSWGVVLLLQVRGVSISTKLPDFLQGFLQEALRELSNKPPVLRALTLGLLSTFLPCGWLYAFALTAAGTGDPLTGGLVMMTFWLGTLPILMGLGLGVQSLSERLRSILPTLSALAVLIIGLLTLLAAGQRAQLGSGFLDSIRPVVRLLGAETEVTDLEEWNSPCCHPSAVDSLIQPGTQTP